jgi:hypothetical protein
MSSLIVEKGYVFPDSLQSRVLFGKDGLKASVCIVPICFSIALHQSILL